MFVAKSLYYSLFVSLRMIPILAIATYAALMLFSMLVDHVWVIVAICGLVYMPLILFLYLMAIRCGLTAMGKTQAPYSKNYLPAVMRFSRFPFMITNLLITIVGVGGSFLLLHFVDPSALAEVKRTVFSGQKEALDELIFALADLPMAVFLLLSLGFCLGVALTGANAGATAHWISQRDTNLDLIWGVTRQWRNLLILGISCLMLPLLGLIVWLGGPLAPIWQFTTLTAPAMAILALVFFWGLCLASAGQALAFVKSQEDIQNEEAKEKTEMAGPIYDDSEVRALRLARMERNSMDATDKGDIETSGHPAE